MWNIDGTIDERTIDVTIGRIGDALIPKVTADSIRTVRSAGYAFNEYFAQTSSAPKKGCGVERPVPDGLLIEIDRQNHGGPGTYFEL
jgi:hypothetical protein